MVLNKCLYNKDCHHRYSPHQRWTIHYQYDCTNIIYIFCHTYVAYRKKISSYDQYLGRTKKSKGFEIPVTIDIELFL